jgi:predicted  nucleic acid-binding Zn-ribbon protein
MASEIKTKQLCMREFGSGGVLDSLLQLSNYCRVEVQNPHPETDTGRRISELRSTVPPVLLEAFDRRSEERKNPVGKAINGSCGCCGVTMPGHQWHQIRSFGELVVCDFCGVILHGGFGES